ncbi:concanavalin A-like lectin/glucanase domain-containing protein [Rhizophagus diaphanus]|nr:concanavalin A-like lectin/glucanase domain-containing protein [Rhizophagus diaphanus] [Rhizophagus sp. MUCL 43196]
MSLNNIEFGRLSITGLKCLLSITHEKEMPFVTPEYEVFRYSAILAAKKVSNDAFKTFLKRLPTLDQLENSIQVENEPIPDHQKIAKELEPLVKFIDFKIIKGSILVDIIEPLEIVPAKIILNIYRQSIKSNNFNLNNTRGKPINLSGYFWDEKACGSKLIIEDNGKIVHALNGCGYQNVRAKIALESNGIFEWDVIIEKDCGNTWVGVCASENLNYETFAGIQPTGWVLSSGSELRNHKSYDINYCPTFHEDGARITVHLDMNKRTCAFTINGKKYREVSEWNNLPSKLYPLVSFCYPGRIRIQPHRKN